MNVGSGHFRFRNYNTIGALAAEDDIRFLDECFVDTGLLRAIQDMDDHRRIILGRTGSGKSALLLHLRRHSHTITINPHELALDYLSNSSILTELANAGISLQPFYKLLWKHVFVVEILRNAHSQLRDSREAPGFWRNLLNSFSPSAKDQASKAALQYLAEYGDSFWQTTEYRIKEITEKVENQLKASIEAKLPSASFGVEAATTRSQERKGAIEQIGKEFVRAIQIKKLNDAVDWLAKDAEGRKNLYIIIDGLDEDWVETDYKHELIRALIDTAKELRAIRTVKILIALRQDLFEKVLEHNQGSGFQREKYTQLCIKLQWTRDQLKSIVDKRVNKLIRDAYTTAKVRIDDIIEPVQGDQGVQYLIDRTLLCPRDIISFFNECIQKADGNARITRHMIKDAEPGYSRARLRALADEWRSSEPLVAQVAELLRGRQANLRLREFTDEYITEFCTKLCVKYWNEKGSLALDIAKRHCEDQALATAREVLRHFLSLLYKIGAIGAKPAPETEWRWAINGDSSIDDLELDDNCGIRVHKALWCALDVSSGKAARRDKE